MASAPEQIMALIEGIRMTDDPDAEDILAIVAEARSLIPPEYRRAPQDHPETTSRLDAATEEDLEWDAVQDAIKSLIAEMEAVAQAKRQQLFENVLDTYYGMEEASRDPKNAHLIPHLERMREAYLRDYGHPIPSREETEARRKREEEKVGEAP